MRALGTLLPLLLAWSAGFGGSVTSLTSAESLLPTGSTSVATSATEIVDSPPASRPAARACDGALALPGSDALWPRADVLVLGEIHGSAETPAFVRDAVCSALEHERPVVLGLEIPSDEQGRIDAYLRSDGDPAARNALLSGSFWTRGYQDGRSSRAMLDLIEAARQMVGRGASLSILCFDVPTRMSGQQRDEAMARAVLHHRTAHPDRRHVLLTGNLHANVEIGTPFDPRRRPMGWFLEQALDRVVALKARAAAGEYWICNRDCGPRQAGGRGDPEARGITLFPERGAGWDGVFDIGVPTASPPAVPR